MRRWVHVGNDDYYITLNDSAEGENRDIGGIQPGLAHLGFVVDDLAGLTERLWQQGYAIDILGMDHPYRKTVYYTDPAGFQFEFLEYRSDRPEERNLYGGESGDFKFNVRSLAGSRHENKYRYSVADTSVISGGRPQRCGFLAQVLGRRCTFSWVISRRLKALARSWRRTGDFSAV
ncbi:VOC family protein [Aliamphritea spongicola]|nr:VOC family protein [Aliamphritea spongicola]